MWMVQTHFNNLKPTKVPKPNKLGLLYNPQNPLNIVVNQSSPQDSSSCSFHHPSPPPPKHRISFYHPVHVQCILNVNFIFCLIMCALYISCTFVEW